MKKLSLYLTLAFVGLFMTACELEDNEFAGLKKAEAESAIVVSGITAGELGVIDLNTVEVSEALDVPAFTVSQTALPDGVELSKAEIQFADGTLLPATIDGKVSGQALSAYVASVHSLRPDVYSVAGTVFLYAAQNGAAVKINAGDITLKVVPKAPVIAAAYYLTGTMNGWDNTNTDFELSNGGNDPYTNPVFTCSIDVAALGYPESIEFKATPVDGLGGDWSGCLAAGDEGKFNYNNDGGNFKIEGITSDIKIVRLTFHMLNGTWSYTKVAFDEFVFFIGATDGWSASDQKVATTTFDGKYTGYVYVADPNGWGLEFKFQRRAGDWADDSQLNSNNMNEVTGDFEKTGDNFKASAGEGIYYVELDLAASTLKGTRIYNMNLVGDFNGWNPADDTQQMTWNASEFCYEITGASVTANGWKFTSNNSWDINLGGDTIDNLVANGANITAVGSTIKLYPTRKTSDKIYCTVE